MRIGDLKTPSRSSGQHVSSLRGVLVEVSHNKTSASAGVSKDEETLIRGLLESLTDGTGVHMDNSRVLFRRTSTGGERERGQDDTSGNGVDWQLASLYMDALRGSRG